MSVTTRFCPRLNKRSEDRLVMIPSPTNTSPYCGHANRGAICPFKNGLSYSVDRQAYSGSFVSGLKREGQPSAVGLRVALVDVQSLKRVPAWHRPHVRQKPLKTTFPKPSFAHAYSTAAVFCKVTILRICASVLGVVIRIILARLRHAVSSRHSTSRLSFQASAALYKSAFQRVGPKNLRHTAYTSALPQLMVTALSGHIRNNGQSRERSTNKVVKCFRHDTKYNNIRAKQQ
jgi:hypothetical protein